MIRFLTLKALFSACIFLFAVAPLMAISYPVVAILLLTKWDAHTTWFGNAKWGDGTLHPSHTTHNYWQRLMWLCWRNPINNFQCITLAAKVRESYDIEGDIGVDDLTHGGWYKIRMGFFYEYCSVRPYQLFGKRCIRVRIGWKIKDKKIGDLCQFAFIVNPIEPYRGV